jgi:thioredoxin-related protein
MNQTTFKDPEVVDYINKNYYAVKFDAESADPITFRGTTFENADYDPNRTGRNSTHDLTKAIAPVNGRIAYPTIVYMDEDFKILSPVQGLQRKEQIMPILEYFAKNIYKNQTWEEYLQTRN